MGDGGKEEKVVQRETEDKDKEEEGKKKITGALVIFRCSSPSPSRRGTWAGSGGLGRAGTLCSQKLRSNAPTKLQGGATWGAPGG